MRPMKAVAALLRDEPLNADERIERLESQTDRKLRQFEEALGVFKDLVLKFHEENEQLKAENASLRDSFAKAATDVKDAIIKPLADAGESFVEMLIDNSNGTAQHDIGKEVPIRSSFDPSNDEMERTVSWMREKFGLPAKVHTEAKAKPGKKKRK